MADDSGLNNYNTNTAYTKKDVTYEYIWEDKHAFDNDWSVDKNQGVFVDPEDGEGWEIRNTFENGGAILSISKNDLSDKTIFEDSNGVVFNVGVAGGWPDYEDSYEVNLWVTCAGYGTTNWVFDSGYATKKLKNIRLEVDTTSCNITNVKVSMDGHDAEHWAGTYGASWKDMDLYIWKEDTHYSLLDDTNEWSSDDESAFLVFWEDPVDGIGN